MRNVLLNNLAKRNDDFLFITADIGYRVIEVLKESFPEKFLNTGVNEQFMASFAAGVAKTKPCFIYSIANFSTLRCLEQIRNDICLHNVPVCVVSVGGGFGYGARGASHHNIEDIACLGSLPGMNVFMPSSKKEVIKATNFFFENNLPTYLRLSNLNNKCEILDEKVSIDGNYFIRNNNSKTLIISNGSLLTSIFDILKNNELKENFDLFSFYRFTDNIFDRLDFSKYNKIITYDESTYIGSSACLLNKYIAEKSIKLKIESFYVNDYTNIPGGNADFYRKYFKMSEKDIKNYLTK